MPFQVSYSSKSTPVGVINFFSAGEDQVTVCDTSVTLTAIVNGDLTGHTIEWEQVAGVPVTWITPLDQLSVTFTTANFQDKRFRFTIDKGKATEQFDEINVYGAPTFDTHVGVSDKSPLLNFGSSLRCNEPELRVGYEFPFDKQTAAACRDSNNPVLFWSQECETDNLVNFIVQERSSAADPWNDEAILPPTQFSYTPLNIGATYRVVAVRLELNTELTATPSNTGYVDTVIGTTNDGFGAQAAEWTEFGNGASNQKHLSIPTYSVNLVTLLACNPDAPEDNYFGSGASKQNYITLPTFTVDQLYLIACAPDAPEDNYFGSGGTTPSYVTIPTYTVLDLEGGDIGG